MGPLRPRPIPGAPGLRTVVSSGLGSRWGRRLRPCGVLVQFELWEGRGGGWFEEAVPGIEGSLTPPVLTAFARGPAVCSGILGVGK